MKDLQGNDEKFLPILVQCWQTESRKHSNVGSLLRAKIG